MDLKRGRAASEVGHQLGLEEAAELRRERVDDLPAGRAFAGRRQDQREDAPLAVGAAAHVESDANLEQPLERRLDVAPVVHAEVGLQDAAGQHVFVVGEAALPGDRHHGFERGVVAGRQVAALDPHPLDHHRRRRRRGVLAGQLGRVGESRGEVVRTDLGQVAPARQSHLEATLHAIPRSPITSSPRT
ncbi:hypothetical protein [Chenggangzhangella methanolivorans]|uniref:Uncharacterized protein n=1 Tax=Chenggangzhangella methanolivorans TaxID=1437009 RepID=A0A9E6RA72_9HYPH|nr:hypothetical protein [Chenggangzhangella methanolivorans]QZN99648.1 hypothetical protein K6K41_23610 [Chenggangzhangella methanolivorans]